MIFPIKRLIIQQKYAFVHKKKGMKFHTLLEKRTMNF